MAPGTEFTLMDPTTPHDEPLPLRWLVEPLIARGTKVLVAGEAGAFKTTILMHLAAHLAAGRRWLGRLPIPEAVPVLYIDEELPEDHSRRLSQLIARGADCHGVPWRVLWKRGLRFRGPDDARELLDRLPNFSPDVIVIDSLTATFAGDENDAQDARDYWRALDVFTRAGITVLVTHHKRKSLFAAGSHDKHAVRGSGDLVAGADEVFSLARVGLSSVAVLRGVRTRSAGEHGGIRLRVDHGHDAITVTYAGPHQDMGTASPRQSEPGHLRALMRFVRKHDGAITRSEAVRYFKSKGESTVDRWLAQAVRAKLLTPVEGQRGHYRAVATTETAA
jgi:hypothetical protein